MSITRRILRFTTKAGIAGGVIYYTYSLGLWDDTDKTIVNYEKFKKEVSGSYHTSPALVRFIDDKKRFVKEKTVDPVYQSASDFHKKWLDFDYSWIESEDGLIKPAWNKGVAVSCDFLAHAPEIIGHWTGKGWEYAKNYMNDSSSVAKASPGFSSTGESGGH